MTQSELQVLNLSDHPRRMGENHQPTSISFAPSGANGALTASFSGLGLEGSEELASALADAEDPSRVVSPYVLLTFSEEFDCVDTQTLTSVLRLEGFDVGELDGGGGADGGGEGEGGEEPEQEAKQEEEQGAGQESSAEPGSGSGSGGGAEAPAATNESTNPNEPTNPTEPTPPAARSLPSPLVAMGGVFLSQAALIERAMLGEWDQLPAIQAVAGHSVGLGAAILASASAGQGALTAMTVARCGPPTCRPPCARACVCAQRLRRRHITLLM